MEEILKKVYEKISKLSDDEFRARLAGVEDHPLVKLFEALKVDVSHKIVWDSRDHFEFAKQLFSSQLTYDELEWCDELLAANDAHFSLAA